MSVLCIFVHYELQSFWHWHTRMEKKLKKLNKNIQTVRANNNNDNYASTINYKLQKANSRS